MEIEKAKKSLEKKIILLDGVNGIGAIHSDDQPYLEIAIDPNNVNVEIVISELLTEGKWHGFKVEFINGAKFELRNEVKKNNVTNAESIVVELLTTLLVDQLETKAMLKTLITLSLAEDQKKEFDEKVKTNFKSIVSKTAKGLSFGESLKLKKAIEEMI